MRQVDGRGVWGGGLLRPLKSYQLDCLLLLCLSLVHVVGLKVNSWGSVGTERPD